MNLIWNELALADLESVRDYIARDSAAYAARFLGRLVEAAEALARFPNLGAVVPELRDHAIREMLYRGYRILHQIYPNHVEVVAVVHGSRDLVRFAKVRWGVD